VESRAVAGQFPAIQFLGTARNSQREGPLQQWRLTAHH
jgi:hypothetical protein